MGHPQTATERSSTPFWAKPIYLVAAMTLLLIVSAGAVVGLQRYSHRQYTTAVETDELGLVTYHYFTSTWRATLAFSPSPQTPPEAVIAEQQEALILLEQARNRYITEAANNQPISVRGDVDALIAVLDQSRALLLAGKYQDALLFMLAQSNAYYYPVADSLYDASQDYARNAARAADLARFAILGVLIATFLVGGGVYWLYRAAQRRDERAAAEREILRRSEARFRPLVESSSDLISILDDEGIILYASPSIERIASVEPGGAAGMSWSDFIVPADRHSLADFLDEVKARPGFKATAELKLRSRHDPTQAAFVEVTCTNRLADPDIAGLVINVRDISERKELEEQLRHQAFHDSLTGLANRLRFTERLEHALQRANRNGSEKVSVLYLDLDYFKNINDQLGHTVGDDLLVDVAKRITACIRGSDTAARLGGDEFAILLEDSRGVSEAPRTAERILEAISQPFRVGGREIVITASIGVVIADAGSMTAEEIIRNADVAMYDAKEQGRGRVQVFEPSMQLSLVERLELTNELNSSLDDQQMVVYYQPTLRLDTERIVGFEALVRWQHPARGLLLPSDFVPLAEESGFIHALGSYVLTEACRQARRWQLEFPQLPGMTMSVNVSARQIQRPGFVTIVRQALKESRLPPENLILEITESILIRHPQDAIATLNDLKKLGIQLALDDFGTGYSSLNYLKRFPIDILKIDRNFIESMDLADRDKMLVQTVIDLGHMLKLDIVAEGIERREQLTRLRDLHCSLGQGFLFAQALDAAAAEDLLQTQADTLPVGQSGAIAGEQEQAVA